MSLSQTSLLNTRICELGFQIYKSRNSQHADKLYRELQTKGVKKLKPNIYIGDEWFCPDRTVAISVPFYLESNLLTSLQHQHVGNVEGATKTEFMRLLRHECGHAFDHAYHISSRIEFIRIFGSPKKKYRPYNYPFSSNSLNFVNNLGDCYAQSHPLEDFAETFAVWLNPHTNWKKFYAHKPIALQKLDFVDSMVTKFGDTAPIAKRGPTMGDARKLKSRLSRYYIVQKNQQLRQSIN